MLFEIHEIKPNNIQHLKVEGRQRSKHGKVLSWIQQFDRFKLKWADLHLSWYFVTFNWVNSSSSSRNVMGQLDSSS